MPETSGPLSYGTDKLCPMLLVAKLPNYPVACKGAACAWFDYLAQHCAVITIAGMTDQVSMSLNELRDEMIITRRPGYGYDK